MNSEGVVMDPEIIKGALALAIQSSMKANAHVEYRPKVKNYIVYLWKDGVLTGAVVKGKSEWDRMITAFENYCRELKESVCEMETDAHLTFMIMNDKNLKQTLLAITDGITYYDFMTEVSKNDSKEM